MCQLYMNSIFIISIGKTLYNAASSIETVVFLQNTASANLYAVILAGKTI